VNEGLPVPNPIKRRSVLNWFLGTSLGGFLAALLYPVTRYLIPPKVAEATAASVTLETKAPAVKPNSGQIFKFGTKPAILVRTPTGELRAFTAVCTHLNCTVQYREDIRHLWCACHNGHFDPVTGRNIGGPPPRPLEQYTVNLRGDTIVVSRGTPGSAPA
jgi:Rieske Fe-S protein